MPGTVSDSSYQAKESISMTTETVKAPETLLDLTVQLGSVAARIDALLEGIEDVRFTEQTAEILKRIESQAVIDEGVAAFHGITHAYIVAGYPELAPYLEVQHGYRGLRTHAVLRNRPHEVALLLPRVLDAVDRTRAERQPQEGE
jgi:hypothetical protein